MEIGAFDRDVEESFKKATEFVSKAKFKASNDDKLKLYGYFKQATVGPCNIPKPGFLYFEEKAKWYDNFYGSDYFCVNFLAIRDFNNIHVQIYVTLLVRSFNLNNFNEIQNVKFF